MSRGTLLGSLGVSTTGVLCGILATYLQMWLIARTELGVNLCWRGVGSFEFDRQWGQSINAIKLECKHHDGLDSIQHFCSINTPYGKNMCSSMQSAQTLQILGIVFGLFAVVFGLATMIPQCERIICGYSFVSVSYTRIAAVLNFVSCLFFVGVFVVMVMSPIYSLDTYKLLSTDNVVPYKEIGCVYDTPLAKPENFFRSNPMHCLFQGPSFVLCIACFVLLLCSGTMNVIYIRNYRGSNPHRPTHRVHSLLRLSSAERFNNLSEMPRKYSLHGALVRHFHQRYGYIRSQVVSLLPLFALCNSLMFLIWSFYGIQYIMTMSVDFSRFHKNRNLLEVTQDLENNTFHDMLITGAHYSMLQSSKNLQYFENNMGDFSPIITVKELWERGARLFPLGVVLSLGVFPYLRVLLWVWFWFIPAEEAMRGRILYTMNILGKYTLGNFFLLNVVGMAEYFDREISIPMFKMGSIDVTIRETFSTGFSTSGVILACFVGMILGEVFVRVHGRAKTYEDDLRRALERDTSSPTNSDSGVIDARRVLAEAPLALLEREFTPIPGKRHRYTPCGMLSIMLALFLLVFLLCSTLLANTFVFERKGLIRKILIPPAQYRTEHSIISFAKDVQSTSIDESTLFVSIFFYTLCVIIPLANIVALLVALVVPMGLTWRRIWFQIVEATQTFSTLDVLLVVLLITWAELGLISSIMCRVVMETVDDVAHKMGFNAGLYTVEFHFPGFGVVIAYAILERLLCHIIVRQFATLLSEDEAKIQIPLQAHDSDEDVSVSNALAFFSPAQRYLSLGILPTYFYAGVPRIFWKLAIALKLMREVSPSHDGIENHHEDLLLAPTEI